MERLMKELRIIRISRGGGKRRILGIVPESLNRDNRAVSIEIIRTWNIFTLLQIKQGNNFFLNEESYVFHDII